MKWRVSIGTIGALFVGEGLASYIQPDSPKDLASFLHTFTSIPKPFAGTSIVIGIILILTALIWNTLGSIWNRIISIWEFFRKLFGE